MKSIIINLLIDGCKEALAYYQAIFGGEVTNTQLADGIEMFSGHEGKYIHAELHINENCIIYFNDTFNSKHSAGNNYQIVLELESIEEIEKTYNALAEEGRIGFPLGDTFWGAKHGVVTDKYGITWGLNYTFPKNES